MSERRSTTLSDYEPFFHLMLSSIFAKGRLSIFRKVVLHNYSTTLVANLIVLVLGIVTSVILARALGPTGRGEIAAILLWPALLSSLGNFGFPDSILYFAAQNNDSIKSIYSFSIIITIIQSVIILPLGYLFLPILLTSQTNEVIELSQYYLLIIPFALISQYNGAILRAYLEIRIYNVTHLIIPIGYFVGILALGITNHITVTSVTDLLIVLNFFSMLASTMYLLLRYKFHFVPPTNFSLMRQMVQYGLQVHFGTVFSTANLRLDQALIAAWLPAKDLGIYVVAVSASSLFLILARAMNIVITPAVARIPERAHRICVFRDKMQQYWLLSIPFLLLLGGILPFAIPIIYGQEFKGSILLSEVLLVSALFLGLKTLLVGGVQAMGDPILASRAEFLASIATVCGLGLTLRPFGIHGAAFVSVFAYALAVTILLRDFQAKYGLPYRDLLVFKRSVINKTFRIIRVFLYNNLI